ncbi:MAG: efflux RND transporter periplasmic adaptor subunit [Deltaproteobacteria bacterium]|nr:efflux RND transporter periplasmic adaptor subunit [Deltaproteobacteria bacterium]
MNGFHTLVSMCCVALAACSGGEATEEPGSGHGAESRDEHEGEGHDEHEGGGHDEHEGEGARDGNEQGDGEEHQEVRLTAEAIARSGIRVGRAERRALGGGTAIPAEVQFEASSTAHVGPLAPGRLSKVLVGLGDRVQRNQLLAVLSSSDVSDVRARMAQVRVRLAAAEAAVTRQEQLTREGLGAQRALVEAQARVDEMRAEAAGLRRQLAVYGGRGGGSQLVAPIDGVIVQIHATLGEMATPDEPAFVITDPTRVWVRGNVPELEIARVALDAVAIVRVHAYPELALDGRVSYVAPALDEETRSLVIRVTLDAADARLRSGLFGTIELLGAGRDARVVAVPTDAVATLQGQQVVFIPVANEPNTFAPLVVELGRRAGGYVEVRSGLAEGAAVVTSGGFTLKSALSTSELSEGHAH